MLEGLLPYHPTLLACAVLAVLMFVQVIVLDVASIRAKHVPGMPITAGHGNFLFRAARAHGNTNENLALFLLLIVLAVLLGAAPRWTWYAAWAFTLARAGHMFFYYFDWRAARSVAFGAGLLAQFALLVIVVQAL
jgi:uncharacterized MAPEG superfamily protein